MYIKQIIIHGFKSYRDNTVVEPFHKRHNVVVGRNGSGKSNFFAAIQFVLSDEYSHLRPEQRQALLHEGTGARAASAFVDIIFDNSDARVPIEKDEISLRRVIGAKKDQYLLNRKLVPRSEVMNLLESAGFSNSNPYYIVKQGKINQMATAPDSQRLKLLREVAGTRVYDERREESMVLLKDANSKMEKINEFLQTIEDKLSTLKEEKEELNEYQRWDRTRRCLEYLIYEKELSGEKKKLDEIENIRKNVGKDRDKYIEQLSNATEKKNAAQKRVKDVKKELSQHKETRESLTEQHQRYIKDKSKLELTIKDLDDEISGDNRSKQRAEAEMSKLNKQIAEKEEELVVITPNYEEMKKKEEQLTTELALKEQKKKELYAKQGRSNQFASKDERDKWIREELKSLNKQIRDKQEHLNKLTDGLKKEGEMKVKLEKKITEQEQEMIKQKSSLDTHNKAIYDLKKQKDANQNERNELWRKETGLSQQLSTLKEDLSKEDQAVRSLAGKPTINGRDSIMKVLDRFRQNGGPDAYIADQYYGQVIENFMCEHKFYTAVEVTAGARLYHHIVESDQVGTRILKEFNNLRLPGEVTFLPLNRLLARRPNYPKEQDATPMVSQLQYKEKFENVFNYLFARTLICRTLEVATSLAKTTALDCVTIEGDQVSSRGSLTGGYLNMSRSRLERQRNRNDLLEQINETEGKLSDLREQLSAVESKINALVIEMQKAETKAAKNRNIYDKLKADVDLAREEIRTIDQYYGPKERSITQCRNSLEALKTSKESLESELNQDLMTQLSVADQEEVDKLSDEIARLTAENKKTFNMRMKLEGEKLKLENLLKNNLRRRRDVLTHALQEISHEDRRRKLADCRAELQDKNSEIETVTTEMSNTNLKIKDAEKRLQNEQENHEKWKNEVNRIQEKMAEEGKDLEKMASKQNMCEQKIAELTEKINDLGTIPNMDLGNKYNNMSNKQLFKELEKANSHLKKFSHVNKKALDQFVSFSDHKEKLTKRKEELDRGEEKIKELLTMLENRKVEVIQFTFKQVSKYFSEVFKKLVPSGRATLVMRTNRDDEDVLPENMTSDNFTGVGIRISFTGGDTEMREMNQLSGGQKSLVALALIFAIQKCDPAPFYLFDEIDQALDGQHRKAVADMIHELSGEAQFITTTFRPELLEHASKFYGVKFRNKVSHIDCVSKEEAKDFVEDDQTHG